MELPQTGAESVQESTNSTSNPTVETGGHTTDPSQSAVSTSPVKVTADTLVDFDGKPVKFGEIRGFQSKFTQASQEAARLRQQLADHQRLVQQYQQQQQAQRQPQADPAAQMLEQLRSQPYLTGEEAVGLLEHMSQEVRQRDQVLIATLNKLKELQGVVNQLHSTHQEGSFNSKIENWVKELGFGPEANDVAKEIYLAYTGDDLETEFPQILANRMKQLEQMFDARKRAAVEAARRQPFLPGRGGNTGPSSPLKIKPSASPAEIADQIWQFRGGSQTT